MSLWGTRLIPHRDIKKTPFSKGSQLQSFSGIPLRFMLLWALIVLKDFILRNWWVQNHCIYNYLEPCTCKSFKLHSNTLFRIVYLNVVVPHIVTVSNIIHVGQWIFHVTLLTLYFWNNVSGKRNILLQRDAQILKRDSIYAFTSYSGGVIQVIHK